MARIFQHRLLLRRLFAVYDTTPERIRSLACGAEWILECGHRPARPIIIHKRIDGANYLYCQDCAKVPHSAVNYKPDPELENPDYVIGQKNQEVPA